MKTVNNPLLKGLNRDGIERLDYVSYPDSDCGTDNKSVGQVIEILKGEMKVSPKLPCSGPSVIVKTENVTLFKRFDNSKETNIVFKESGGRSKQLPVKGQNKSSFNIIK
jgi:hypothetical protein